MKTPLTVLATIAVAIATLTAAATADSQDNARSPSVIKLKDAALIKAAGQPAYLRFRTAPMDATVGDQVFALIRRTEKLQAVQRGPRFWTLAATSPVNGFYLTQIANTLRRKGSVRVQAAFENGVGATPYPIEVFRIERFTRPAS